MKEAQFSISVWPSRVHSRSLYLRRTLVTMCAALLARSTRCFVGTPLPALRPLRSSQTLAVGVDSLEEAEARMRKAEAFKTEELEHWRAVVAELRQVTDSHNNALDSGKHEDAEVVFSQEQQMSGGELKEENLSLKVMLDRLSVMSGMEAAYMLQSLGSSFIVAVVIVGLVYWVVGYPLFMLAIHDLSGEWPTFEDFRTLNPGPIAGATLSGQLQVVTPLLAILRLFFALLLTPWTAEKVVFPIFQYLESNN
eukprot:TRINITY_DN87031_c0_g1_i1.p1 TRINITY_DN87031_c0_g1~~TRINITY_DN87031_c0_g1_i1.p1  ORF type:complete len:252 (-),score=46.01 TRINITY_DN87031_c0_g1_i1:88-843(-)